MSMLDYAIEKASEIPYDSGRVRVYAVITDAKGRMLGEGSNSYSKTHPVQAMYAEKAGKEHKVFLHAEIAALVRAVKNGEPSKIFIARVDFEGNPCIAAPCPVCSIALKDSGIETVEHTL